MVVPNCDAQLIEMLRFVVDFVRLNPVTIASALFGLKLVAKYTDSTADDKIYTMLVNLVNKLTFKGAVNGIKKETSKK